MAPPSLAARVRSLPPILYRNDQGPMPGYSQAPRGLSVQSRVPRIFTRPSISPGPLPRQHPSRYTFRAGRNLPDKEFRYLRTVIVTAAVHWGFGSALARLPLTVQHRAGVSPYTSACAFAETCVFGKQSLGLFLCGPLGRCHPTGAPLLPKLRGDFAEFLSKGSPARLRLLASPTCVGFSTGTVVLASGFSRQRGFGHFGTVFPSPSPLGVLSGGLAYRTPLQVWTGTTNGPLCLSSCVPASLITNACGTGISTGCPSPTPLGLGLGPDLPWVDDPCPGNLWLSAAWIPTMLLATHAGIRTSAPSTAPYGTASLAGRTLPYHHTLRCDPQLR